MLCLFRPCISSRGAVAQLGERLNGIQEVVGSIPIGSTRLPQENRYLAVHKSHAKSLRPQIVRILSISV